MQLIGLESVVASHRSGVTCGYVAEIVTQTSPTARKPPTSTYSLFLSSVWEEKKKIKIGSLCSDLTERKSRCRPYHFQWYFQKLNGLHKTNPALLLAKEEKKIIFQPWRTRPIQYVFTLSSHIKTESTDNNRASLTHSERMLERSGPGAAPPPHPPRPRTTEWAVLHSTASIIHQAAENIVHIHKFPQRELWSRWCERLYGSDRISHSGLINNWTVSQMLLAALHMLQLPLTGQGEIIITSNAEMIAVCAAVCGK